MTPRNQARLLNEAGRLRTLFGEDVVILLASGEAVWTGGRRDTTETIQAWLARRPPKVDNEK
jgi:hypothetical protein